MNGLKLKVVLALCTTCNLPHSGVTKSEKSCYFQAHDFYVVIPADEIDRFRWKYPRKKSDDVLVWDPDKDPNPPAHPRVKPTSHPVRISSQQGVYKMESEGGQ